MIRPETMHWIVKSILFLLRAELNRTHPANSEYRGKIRDLLEEAERK